MAKKKKTRQQKEISDLRRQAQSLMPKQPRKTKPKETTIVKPTQSISSEKIYPNLASDIKKTSILTAAIVTAQLVLYFLLTNNILNIPRLNY
ncbi:hypothetical protein KKG52_01785 [Patescibacteria group bacterium]|nr:hypothetical protein [Patescibacteria group bacterium]